MRIITLSCDECGSIVAGNVLEKSCEVPCPGIGCEETLRFDDLADDEQEYLREHSEKYRMD